MTRNLNQINRREAMRFAGLSTSAFAVALTTDTKVSLAAPDDVLTGLQKVQLGLVADVHQDIIHDAWARMRVFVEEMKRRQADAVLQLGDFALPRPQNQSFLNAWNEYTGPKYHVLGNHDTDLGFTKQQTMSWWDMPDRYYSFDVGGWHFVVLDGNDKNPGPWTGYVRYVAADQLKWLADDLAATSAPTMVFSHQTLESDGGVANSDEVRQVLEQANRNAGWTKVYACLCGHHHTDGLTEISGIRYIHVNSMSYKWVGDAHQRQRFAPHIEQAYPTVSKTIPYRDPLYTMLTLDPQGEMQIEGKQTEFIAPTPAEMKLPNAEQMLPIISARQLKIV